MSLLPLNIVCCVAVLAQTVPEPERAEKVRWLEGNAFAIDPDSGEFTDPVPVLDMFEGVEVVLLGEAAHGDGTTFEAKTQLVRFLHQELGFDVLMFESGMYDCARAWQRIRAGEKSSEVVKDALFDIWSACRQAQGLFDYLDAQKDGDRPLELAGFDLQLSGAESQRHLVEELDARLAALGLAESAFWKEARAGIEEIASGDARWDARSDDQRRKAVEAFQGLAQECSKAVAGKPAQGIDQVIQSLTAVMRFMRGSASGNTEPGLADLRDDQMAKNFLWMRERLYPGRKIIGWGHTGHFLRDRGALPRGNGLSMGEPLSPVLKEKMLVIAATTYEGTTGLARRGARAADRIAPAPADSLESMLRDAGYQRCLLDLRPTRETAPWLWTPQTARLLGHSPTRAPWPRAVDAVLYLAEIQASVPVD